MSVAKKTISLPKKLLDKAEARVEQLHYSTFSDYLQELIRRDTNELREEPPPYGTKQPQIKVPSTKGQKADKN